MTNTELTRQEYQFVIALLDTMQLSGSAAQVRAALALRDSCLEKLRTQLRASDSERMFKQKNPENDE